MNTQARWLVCGCTLLLTAIACGDDDDNAPDGGDHAGNGGSHAGSSSAGSGGRAGSTSAGQSGSNAGASGSKAGSGGSNAGSGGSGSGGSGAAGDDAGEDAGTDAGMMTNATVCKAPVMGTAPNVTCPTGNPPAIKVTLLKSGLSGVPIFVTQAPGDDDRLFVVERSGRISLLDPSNGDNPDFMMVPGVVAGSGPDAENGLLGLAFHPDWPSDPRFFVYYYGQGNTGGAKNQISAFTSMEGDPDHGDPDSEEPLLSYSDPEGNHNGGMLAFGPDGCLFVASGDGGGSNDQHGAMGNGQNLGTELGKILRLDVDAPMMGAPGNLQGAGSPHIWDYGLRNPWRFSFDRMTGDMYIGDVGQGAWEEVDVELKGDGHKNYGWKIMEGAHCRPGADPCDMNGLVEPVTEYPHGNGDDCIIGGYVYRGSEIDGLQGYYLYGDNGFSGGMGRRIRAFVWDGGDGTCETTPHVLTDLNDIDLPANINSFGEDNAGELYVATTDSVYRIDPN